MRVWVLCEEQEDTEYMYDYGVVYGLFSSEARALDWMERNPDVSRDHMKVLECCIDDEPRIYRSGFIVSDGSMPQRIDSHIVCIGEKEPRYFIDACRQYDKDVLWIGGVFESEQQIVDQLHENQKKLLESGKWRILK